MENKKLKNDQISRSKTDVLCKKHPNHWQSPGVCSFCLRERLSQLSSSSSCTNTINIASSCSSYSSLSSSHYTSSESSPVHHLYSVVSEPKGSTTMSFLRSVKNVLTKSKSMAFVARAQGGDVRYGKKKGGFWSKLFFPRRSKKINEGSVHSRVMIGRVISTTKVH
ncbi:hypothetical protein ACSBR2_029553 [Camellia fascicularis]